MNPEQALQVMGLTKAEAALYVKLLLLGEATASELAKKTLANRTFTYDRINKLTRMGLISEVVKERRKYFRAAPPSQRL